MGLLGYLQRFCEAVGEAAGSILPPTYSCVPGTGGLACQKIIRTCVMKLL